MNVQPPPSVPVKTVAGAGGGGVLAVFIVWVVGYLGGSLSAEDGVIIGSAITAAGTYIAHHGGVSGVFKIILHGDGKGA